MKNETFLILTDDFPPSSGGGIASWAYQLSQGLIEKGYDIFVFTKKKREKLVQIQPKLYTKVVFIRGHDWNRFRGLYMMLYTLPLLLLKKNLIIISSTWQHLIGIIYLRNLFHFKLICFAHGTDITKSLNSKRKKKTMIRVFQNVDFLTPVSYYLKQLIEKNLPTLNSSIKVIHNGIDTEHFIPIADKKSCRKKLGFEENKFILLTIGRTLEVKGFRQVIKALPEIINKYSNILYLIVGKHKEPEIIKINNLITKLNIQQNIMFIPQVNYENLQYLYNAADIFILAAKIVRQPFYQEDNFPMSILEACSCEIPVIGGKSGGIPEMIVDRKSGLLVSAEDKDDVIKTISVLVENNELRRRIGREGRIYIENNFKNTNMVNNLLNLVK